MQIFKPRLFPAGGSSRASQGCWCPPILLPWMSPQLLPSTPKTQPVPQYPAIKTFPLERRHDHAQISILRRGDNCSQTKPAPSLGPCSATGTSHPPLFPPTWRDVMGQIPDWDEFMLLPLPFGLALSFCRLPLYKVIFWCKPWSLLWPQEGRWVIPFSIIILSHWRTNAFFYFPNKKFHAM